MSSIDINKLIQESISNRPVNENGNDPEAGLENALVGVNEDKYADAVAALRDKNSGLLPGSGKASTLFPSNQGGTAAVTKQGGVVSSVKDYVSNLSPTKKVLIGGGAAAALGAGYAAKKYLQRRKAKKA